MPAESGRKLGQRPKVGRPANRRGAVRLRVRAPFGFCLLLSESANWFILSSGTTDSRYGEVCAARENCSPAGTLPHSVAVPFTGHVPCVAILSFVPGLALALGRMQTPELLGTHSPTNADSLRTLRHCPGSLRNSRAFARNWAGLTLRIVAKPCAFSSKEMRIDRMTLCHFQTCFHGDSRTTLHF